MMMLTQWVVHGTIAATPFRVGLSLSSRRTALAIARAKPPPAEPPIVYTLFGSPLNFDALSTAYTRQHAFSPTNPKHDTNPFIKLHSILQLRRPLMFRRKPIIHVHHGTLRL